MAPQGYERVATAEPEPEREAVVQVEEAPATPVAEAEAEALPDYDAVAVALPSYAEVHREKVAEGTASPGDFQPESPLTVDEVPTAHGQPLGTDIEFVATFFVALVFNFIGYVFAFCFSSSIAGRCGALAGLGLYLINAALHGFGAFGHAGETEEETEHERRARNFYSPLFTIVGFIFLVRGITAYVACKRLYLRSLQQTRLPVTQA